MSPNALGRWDRFGESMRRGGAAASIAVAAALAIGIGAALHLTRDNGFLGRYDDLERRYTALETSAHRDVPCNGCHGSRGGEAGYRAALVGDFYRGLAAKSDAPVFVRFAKPEPGACLACHDRDWSEDASRTLTVPHPAHLRVASETRDCVECHKWVAHEEVYMEKHKTMPFSAVCASFGCHAGTKTKDECADCHHSLQDDKGPWTALHEKTVRATGPNGCLESCHEADECRMCHTTGERPDFKSSVATAGVKAIERMHVRKDWLEKHGTPALEDASKCAACHVSQAECEDCHAIRPAFHDPKSTWLNRHAELAADVKDGKAVANADKERRCLVCHEEQWCEECHEQFKER